MALPKVIPALADLTQDIAGAVPVQLLYSWAEGDQDESRATALLDPHRIEGSVVSSDTSGLSRMTRERDLLDVLALISEPKQILHGIGVSIGGRPIGTLVADNTQTFYPGSVETPTIVSGMWEATQRISCELPIGVGLCVHRGAFFELGGGLYGHDAQLVEALAEHYARAGEILVTPAARGGCPGDYAFVARDDLRELWGEGICAVTGAPRIRHLDPSGLHYPHPYPDEFFEMLLAFKGAADREPVRRQIYDKYLKSAVVLFLARARDTGVPWNGATLLDDLVSNVLVDALVTGLDKAAGHVAGLGGGLGILTFDSAAEAFDTAQALRQRFAANGLPVKIGIASGPVLMFSNPHGPSGITGSPVNIASKISEDAGVAGLINVAADVAAQLPALASAKPFEIAVGGVVLRGVSE